MQDEFFVKPIKKPPLRVKTNILKSLKKPKKDQEISDEPFELTGEASDAMQNSRSSNILNNFSTVSFKN